MTATYPVGVIARFDRDLPRADEALAALPNRAVALLDALRGAGWGWTVGWNEDTGGNAFVTVKGRQAGTPGAPEINVSWHTRQTGTPRLFGCIIARRQTSMYSRGWQDAPVKAAEELVTSNPAPPVVPV